ncbi:MAG: response regulator [Treponema sp.]|nr:response regulator [Treponema sp.]MCL2272220.1 response regulator [Treponema sp.]
MKEPAKSVSQISESRKKIIYVDDIQYSLTSVKNRLQDRYDVYTMDSAEKMFEILEKITPDLILMDVNMPDVDGYEAIKSLKADERYSAVPVIFLTGKSDRESVVKGLSLGAADYIIKPYTASKLMEIVGNNLSSPEQNEFSAGETVSNKPVVLIVDDVTSMLRAMQYALHDRYKVYILSKSQDALDFLRTKSPDLILLDYLMPVLNGFDLIQMIRVMPEYEDTPIIIITTEGTMDHVNKAISIGASDFIVKPFKPKELNDKVAKHIRIAKQMRLFKEDLKSNMGY